MRAARSKVSPLAAHVHCPHALVTWRGFHRRWNLAPPCPGRVQMGDVDDTSRHRPVSRPSISPRPASSAALGSLPHRAGCCRRTDGPREARAAPSRLPPPVRRYRCGNPCAMGCSGKKLSCTPSRNFVLLRPTSCATALLTAAGSPNSARDNARAPGRSKAPRIFCSSESIRGQVIAISSAGGIVLSSAGISLVLAQEEPAHLVLAAETVGCHLCRHAACVAVACMVHPKGRILYGVPLLLR